MPAEHPIIEGPSSPLDLVGPQFNRVVATAVNRDGDMGSGNMLRNYDAAVVQWFQGITVLGGQQGGRIIPMFKASPLRAFATYRQLLATNKLEITDPNFRPQDFSGDGQIDLSKFPLPFANMTRGNVTPRTSEQNQNFPVRNIRFIEGTNKRRTVHTRYPKPVNIPYQIDIWCRYENHMNWYVFRIMEQFNGPMANWKVKAPFASGGDIFMAMRFVDLADNSDLEVDKDRLLRQTLSLEVQGWLFFDLQAAPTFEILKSTIAVGSGESGTAVTGSFTPIMVPGQFSPPAAPPPPSVSEEPQEDIDVSPLFP